MLKRLSEANDDQLRYYLARIREIASLGDEGAMIETDKLLWEFIQQDRDALDEEDELQEADYSGVPAQFYPGAGGGDDYHSRIISEAMTRLRRKIQDRTVSFLDINYFRHSVSRMSLHPYLQEADGEEASVLKEECSQLAHTAEGVAFENVLGKELAAQFKNINSVLAMNDTVNHALEQYTKGHEMTPELTQRVRQVKERGARFRATKKLASAKIADDAGFSVKADGLRREAAGLLAQDWDTIFSGEDAPKD